MKNIKSVCNFLTFMFMMLMWVCIVVNPTVVCADDIDIDVTIVPRASYFVDELYEITVEKTSLKEIASITLTNNTSDSVSLILRIQCQSETMGNSNLLVDYITSYQDFPIDISANGGTYTISNLEIESDMLDGGTSFVDDDIIDEVVDAYGESILIKTAGLIPEDTYTYSIWAFNSSDSGTNTNTALGSTSEEIYIPLEFGNIDIIYPDGGDVISTSVSYPTFMWGGLSVRDNVSVIYKIFLWEAESDDYESVIEQRPIFEDSVTGETSLTYPSYAEQLIPNTTYVWKVEAYDEAGYAIGTSGSSEISTFTFGEPDQIQLVNKEIDVTGVPIQLMWSSSNPNTNFLVLISKDNDFQDIIFEEITSEKMLSLGGDISLEPGETYYWKVVTDDDYRSTNRSESEVGTIIVRQQLELVYPTNETIETPSLSLFWSGSSELNYKVEVSSKSSFERSYQFFVNGGSLVLNSDNFNFIPGKRYYWKVTPLNEFNKVWGASSSIGSFKIKNIEKPVLISPMSETLSGTSVFFAFNPVEWADYYEIEVLHPKKKNKVLLMKEVNTSTYMLNLAENPLPELREFKWRVKAVSDEKNIIEYSEIGKFSFDIQKDITIISSPENSGKGLQFEWGKIRKTSTYLLEVSDNDSFLNTLKFKTRKNSYNIDSKLPSKGVWFWRLSALAKDGSVLAKSEINVFDNSDITQLDENTIYISPKNTVEFFSDWSFKWVSSKQEQVLYVDTTASFEKPIIVNVKDGRANPSDLSMKWVSNQTYFWKVQDKQEVLENQDYETFVIASPKLQLTYPINVEISSQLIKFGWFGSKESRYIVEISDQSSFNAFQTIQTKNTEASTSLLKTGDFFWRVKEIDEKGQVLQMSSVASFKVGLESGDVDPSQLKTIERFIKNNVSEESSLKSDEWVCESVDTVDNNPLTDEDVQYLIENPEKLKRVIEQ